MACPTGSRPTRPGTPSPTPSSPSRRGYMPWRRSLRSRIPTLPSARCGLAAGRAEVNAGKTAEVLLVSQCSAETGGLDTTVTLNAAPVIRALEIEGGKFLCTNHLERTDQKAARAVLDRLEKVSGGRPPLLDVWQHEGEGRVALLEGRTVAALAAFGEQIALARRYALAEELFRGYVSLGRAHEASGRLAAALAAYRSAEEALDGILGKVPLAEGVHAAAALHRRSSAELVRALVRLGRVDEAAEAARRARVRALVRAAQAHRVSALDRPALTQWRAAVGRYQSLRASAEDEADGDIPADELAARGRTQEARAVEVSRALDTAFQVLARAPEGRARLRAPTGAELFIVYYRDGPRWSGFALTRQGARLRALPAPDPGDQARALVAPFAAEIHRASALVLLLPDELWSIDFHALPFEGRPLSAHLPVSYALDVCCGTPARAGALLVVADPRGDLPAARDEGRTAAALLASAGPVTLLQGADSDYPRVRAALEGAWLFHYAGHGEHVGVEGYGSVLPLGRQTRLSLGDILALGQVPRRVVLSACEAARVSEEGGISLAHAFIAAGSDEVIAAPRPVSDRGARTLSLALYATAPTAAMSPPPAPCAPPSSSWGRTPKRGLFVSSSPEP
jgi:tetratricopeptide (TPR) repeat protein